MIKDFPPDLLELGCSPTMSAYTDQQQTIHVNPKTLLYRTSGAHLHMSFKVNSISAWGNPVPQPRQNWSPWTKVADLLLGVPFTYVFGDELEVKRRKLYGKAGEYRFQQYPSGGTGLEYRVLSSRLWNHPGTFSLFTGIFKYILGHGYTMARVWSQWDPAWEDTIQQAINEADPKALQEMLKIAAKFYATDPNYLVLAEPSQAADPLFFWNQLREMSMRGEFPDAGFLNPAWKEGHDGFTEWSEKWNLKR
jgi:hypothetical protein